jgi:hypothetical protein
MSNCYHRQVLSAFGENSLQKLLALGLEQECCNSGLDYILGTANMGLDDQKIDGVPQFVSYFVPIIEIMRDLGGQGRPRQIFEELIKSYDISESFLSLTNKNGGSKFENPNKDCPKSCRCPCASIRG